MRRKHHCRACGRVVCGDCSTHLAPVKGYVGDQRTCDRCFLQEPPAPSPAARLAALLGCCPCVASEAVKARRRRKAMLLAGGRFSRRKQNALGLSLGGLSGTEQVTLRLSADGTMLVWAAAASPSADAGGDAGSGGGGGSSAASPDPPRRARQLLAAARTRTPDTPRHR